MSPDLMLCCCFFLLQNRKNDETAYMQMLKLKRDLAKAR